MSNALCQALDAAETLKAQHQKEARAILLCATMRDMQSAFAYFILDPSEHNRLNLEKYTLAFQRIRGCKA